MWRGAAGLSVAVVLSIAATPDAARGFALLGDVGADAPDAARVAPRWDVEPVDGRGLGDGIQVAIAPSVPSDLEAAPDEVPVLDHAIDAAFGMWQQGWLRFDVEHDSPNARRGAGNGAEIDVFTVPADDPVWAGNDFYGVTFVHWQWVADRLLANGQRVPGYAITGADIFLNSTKLLDTQREFGVPIGISAFAVTRLLAHEVGHAIGLDHPNVARNFDYDTNPLDVEVVDSRDPFAGLLVSPNFDPQSIMSNAPCGVGVAQPCGALFFQSLRPDDRMGRDVLYGAPEPATATLLGVGATALAVSRRRAQRAPRVHQATR